MIIYRNNTEYFAFDFEPRGRERRRLMEEHSVSLSFELPNHVGFEKGDSIVYNGKSFYLAKDYIPTINKRTGGYIYDLTFYDITERFKDILLKYEMEGVKELDFTIISSGSNLLDIVIASLSQIGTFTKGLAPVSEKEFHFQNISVYDALNLIAEQYEMDWWLEEDTLNIGKLEFGTPVILAHDRELDDISFSPSSQEMPTRLYAFGSTKNLPIDYGVSGDTTNAIFENRLRLPNGYIDLFPNLPENQIVEGVKIFEDVFPRQQNEIIEVMEALIGETTIYSFRGDNTFELTQEDVISGQALKVAFETGNLAGREFDLIIKGDNWFEIKYQQSGERVIPNQTLKPRAGDKFFFFNFDVGSVLPSLVTDAESELASKAQEYLDKLGEEYVYTVRTRSVYCRENDIDLSIGQTVTITSPAIGSRTSRVMGYEKDIYDVYDCTYQVGDYSKYSRLGQIKKETSKKADKEEVAEIKDDTGEIKNIVQNLDEALDEVEEKVNNSRVGVANLLRNTGFLGDFQSLTVDALTAVTGSTPIDTNPLAHWVHSDTSVIDAPSRSGKGVRIGSIQQNVVLKIGEPYVLSFWARGTSLIVELVDTIEIPLTSEYKRYSFDVIAPETEEYTFSLIDSSNTAEVYEIMLSNGNAKVGYAYAEEDDVKAISQLQAINVITDAIKNYDTDILGGLILTSMIQLGKYKDGVMEKVTSGINGIYNNDDDPAIWAGGSLEDAIRTVQKFIDNPNYEPTEEEWAEMANIVFTHGGDGFFRGYVYALGGFFRGKVESNFEGNRIVIDPKDRSLKMYNVDGQLTLSLLFKEEYNYAELKLYSFKENGEVLYSARINSNEIYLFRDEYVNGVYKTDSASIFLGGLELVGTDRVGTEATEIYRFSVENRPAEEGQLRIQSKGLPTSDEGLSPGMWYIDNGTLKIKT